MNAKLIAGITVLTSGLVATAFVDAASAHETGRVKKSGGCDSFLYERLKANKTGLLRDNPF